MFGRGKLVEGDGLKVGMGSALARRNKASGSRIILDIRPIHEYLYPQVSFNSSHIH